MKEEETVKLVAKHIDNQNPYTALHTGRAVAYVVDIVQAISTLYPTVPPAVLEAFVETIIKEYGQSKSSIDFVITEAKKIVENDNETGRARTQAQRNIIEASIAKLQIEEKLPDILKKWVKVFVKNDEDKTFPTIQININSSNKNNIDDYIEVNLD